MNSSSYVILAVALLSAACANRTADGDEDEPPAEAREVTTCRDWCEVAVDCSVIHKERWDFSTQAECEDRCMEYYDGLHASYEGECDDPMVTLYQCMTMVDTCEDFLNFEKFAWVLGGLTDGAPCLPELDDLVDAGCT